MAIGRKIVQILLLTLFSLNLNGQIKDSAINIFQIRVNYSFHIPTGDIENRFGPSHMIGMSLDYKFKNNWSLGLQGSYMFGGFVKDSTILDHLKDRQEGIINEYGEYGTILLTQRGFYGGASIGKLFPVLSPNPNSGIKIDIGAGILQHHIHIENKDNNIPAVLGDYRDGYDRLTYGLSMRQFIGYQYFDPNGYYNFFAGFEFYQAWTYNRRSINYDTGLADTAQKNDFLWGFNVGWIIPIYRKAPNEFYYY
ncbi:MAG: hypothetical protein U9N51_07365 [Bacteroidota bacterium]|nr:hypothetical protein [Bacteroidota bacterium]